MDNLIISMVNTIASKTIFFTEIMFLIVHNELVKGGVIIAILWYLWFNVKIIPSHGRGKIITTLYGTIGAIIVGRCLANVLPYRARPILNPEFAFTYQIDEFSWLNTLSSFPSDHAILFFSLATGIFSISKKWGVFSFVYVFLIICFPRIYLGFHYFTDIFVGGVIGVLMMWLILKVEPSKRLSRYIMKYSSINPGLFYACFFILSYQIVTLFNESRALASYVFKHIF
ncbi:phosphatase PAP2 family protein [Arenibacter sp. BSSL-BM3]|uniref:Phosphatase PAP2 family protein n=1 Tax=Arenibacter arenosicollis TaxID=2762274 RepID=A0ABR7QRM9_9FLAO|nr:phosphatase PAP2 family protein [Arenibacter arenosicollis]MBC8769833.1 phosphatase PAP2 family protein [Arenibacter arenosicollis]